MHKTQTLSILLLLAALPVTLWGRKFYDDDPLWKMPAPLDTPAAEERELNDFYDYFVNTFASPAERQGEHGAGLIPAQAVNTLGEVPDSEWFTNRIGHREMSVEELLRGPGDDRPPSREGKWTIVSAKTEGVTPGFMIKDATGERYLLKFDPLSNPEMASGADLLGTRFFHALGYNVPQNYIVHFRQEDLAIAEDVMMTDVTGLERPLRVDDIEKILRAVPKRSDGSIRGLASRLLKGKPLGGFRYYGTRSDDPNDIVPHEHRRDLRGYYVFCSWLGHDDSRSINTLDMLVKQDGKQFVRHHLIDFGSILGSASEEANSPRGGNQYLYAFKPALVQIATLGFYVPVHYRWHYMKFPAIGRFEWEIYQPDKWKPEYKNPAFDNRLPDDTYWAAKKVMAFSDEAISAIVKLAQYSDPEAEAWLVQCLIERRDRVGREYFSRVLPLDDFIVEENRLQWTHLGEKYGFGAPPPLEIAWSRFDNQAETHAPLVDAGAELPQEARQAADGAYFAAHIAERGSERSVTVYLRKRDDRFLVVGIDRTW
ncbi:MAG: hypothetical protein R2724_12340 [Bryobacterales bacterium]